MTFTLTMLGTDTVFTPEPQKRPKVDYPRGETLSVVASLIAGEAVRDDKAVSPYVSNQGEVVIGPTTTGKEVADRIRCGVLAILKALNRGETVINLVAHSRGSVEAILIAHEINSIQAKYREAQQAEKPAPNLADVLAVLAQEELSQPKGNTGKVQQLLAKMPEIKELNEAFNDSIGKAHINLFAIEPVPGDDPLYGWVDKRYCQIPDIVTDCEVYLFENERTRFFTPLQLEPSINPEARFSLVSVPGHHGSGLSGNNRDQATVLVPENKGEASHVQELVFFKIMAFLGKHGVEFKKPEEWGVQEGSLLSKVVDELEKLDKRVNSEMPWGEELVLPICFRLYSDILQNIEAYQHFNATNYPSLGRAAHFRYILTKDKTYKKFFDVLPQSPGFVNSEHARIAEKILFKILGITELSETLPLDAVVNQATDVLAKGIQAYYRIKKTSPEFRNNPVAQLLINAEGKKQVIDSFGVLVDKISQSYVYNHLESEQQSALFASIQKTFVKFKHLSESLEKDPGVDQEKTLLELINTILSRVKHGITSTLMLQYQGLLDEVAQLRKRFNTCSAGYQFDEHIKDAFRSVVYSSTYLLPNSLEEEGIRFFNEVMESSLLSCTDKTGDEKILYVWGCITTTLLEKDGFWADDIKQNVRAFDLKPKLSFIMDSMNKEPELTLEHFKLTCRRLDDFRSGLEIFRQFEPDIKFDEMTEHLDEMEWSLVHKATDFMAGKDKPLQAINWEKFDRYIQGMVVLHGADDPVKLENQQTIAKLNQELLQMKDKLAEEKRLHEEQLAAMQKKLEQADMLVKEQQKKVYGSETLYQQKLTFWQAHDETVLDRLKESPDVVVTVS